METNLCISILEFKYLEMIGDMASGMDLCISILEFKFFKRKSVWTNADAFMYFYIRI